MTTFTTLVSAVKAMVAPTAKAPAAKKAEAAAPVKMAQDSLTLGKRPADDGYAALQRAQIVIADRLGENDQAIAASKAKEAKAGGAEEQMVLQAGRGALVRDGEKLLALARLTGRLAANATATDADRTKLAALVREACAGNLSGERLNQLVVAGEDVVRNAGRPVPTDRGLLNATQQLATRVGQLEARIGHLEASLGGGMATEDMQKVQLQLASLHQDRDALLGLKAQADRLANRRGATPADAQAMSRLLAQAAAGHVAPETLRGALADAEYIARNAGGPAGDRAVHQATKALAERIGAVEATMADLVHRAQDDVSAEELQRLQIRYADMVGTRDALLAVKGEADRVMNRRDDLDAGDRETLLHHLNAADTNVSSIELGLLLADIQSVGR